MANVSWILTLTFTSIFSSTGAWHGPNGNARKVEELPFGGELQFWLGFSYSAAICIINSYENATSNLGVKCARAT